MPSRSAIRYTYQDYLTIPADTSRRHEIVDGALFVTPAPRVRHQQVVSRLVRVLGRLADDESLGEVLVGPVTVRLHEEGVVEPDLVFVHRDRMDIVDLEGAIHGPPDLVVEVLSPSNRSYDQGAKRKQYLDHGVAELWLVDAEERSVEVWRPGMLEPLLARGLVVWNVGGRSFEVSLDEVVGER